MTRLNQYLIIVLCMGFGFTMAGQNESPSAQIDRLLSSWHEAAAEANFEDYFSKISDDAIYIGTDPKEHWTKRQFSNFAKPYFDRGKAWNFKAVQRHIYLSEDGNLAWFDELLETWMGLARGSGVLAKQNGAWKIKQYVLSFTIPNSKSQDVVDLKQTEDQTLLEKLKND